LIWITFDVMDVSYFRVYLLEAFELFSEEILAVTQDALNYCPH